MSSTITRLIYLVTISGLDSISEASELCWDSVLQAYGSTKSMLSGMKRLQWDVWLEVSGVPADHCGVARVFWSKESTLSVLRMGGWIGGRG